MFLWNVLDCSKSALCKSAAHLWIDYYSWFSCDLYQELIAIIVPLAWCFRWYSAVCKTKWRIIILNWFTEQLHVSKCCNVNELITVTYYATILCCVTAGPASESCFLQVASWTRVHTDSVWPASCWPSPCCFTPAASWCCHPEEESGGRCFTCKNSLGRSVEFLHGQHVVIYFCMNLMHFHEELCIVQCRSYWQPWMCSAIPNILFYSFWPK